jgi:osmoprotectant transport system ATP-binding protein
MPPSRAALAAADVSKQFGDVVALDHVSLEVPDGACVALVGESGSGKSTLLRCFNRLIEPDSGTIRVGDVDAMSLDPIELRRRIGYVPQDGGLLPHWTVQRNVELVPRLNGRPNVRDRARSALDLVGMDPSEFGVRWPRDLSGGQRQRVAMARALADEPKVLLLDEPFGALDAITRSDLQEMFAVVRTRLGTTSVLVTHDLHEATMLATCIVVLHHGRVEQVAPPATLVAEPANSYVRTLLERARVTVGV